MIVFWGDPLHFSNGILRLATAEVGSMTVSRVGGLDEIDPDFEGRLYIFFDDDVAEDILDAPRAWLAEYPAARWVLAYRDEEIARRFLELRRSDPCHARLALLPMNLPIDKWTPMFRLVLSGDCFLPLSLLDSGAQTETADPAIDGNEIDVLLTPREREVLSLVAEGQRNKTIAHELGLSEHTIKLHLHHVITKINVRNRTQAAQWFLTRRYGRPR